MEYINCNFCNNDDSELLFSKKDKFRISDKNFNIVRCKNCGLIYVNPRPQEIEIVKFYPETYSWKETLRSDSFFTQNITKLEKTYRYHLLDYEVGKVLEFTKLRNGKVLDIGCGTGDRLEVFRRKGFDTYGVEISSSAKYAKEKFKLNVTERDLFEANFPDNFFDLVTMYNVLEHTHGPKELLQEVSRILKKGGFLVIQVPNTDSLQFKMFRKRWAAFDVPRDLYYFSSGLLTKILNDSGFDVLKIDHFSNWWHPPTLVVSLFPHLDPRLSWLEEGSKHNPIFKRLFWILLTLTIPPFTFFESIVLRGAIITSYAKNRLS